nr:immunoglobulin light chain junction region [Macaca mulatta]
CAAWYDSLSGYIF